MISEPRASGQDPFHHLENPGSAASPATYAADLEPVSTLVFALRFKNRSDVPGAMEHSDDFNPVVECPVDDYVPLELRDEGRSEARQPGVVRLVACPNVRGSDEDAEGFLDRSEESIRSFVARLF